MSKLKGITRLGTLVIVTLLMAVLFYPMKSIAWETDTDRPTMDYKNFWIDKDTETFVAVKKCEDACKEDSLGANDWKSKKKGYYKIGAQVGSTLIKEEKYTLESWPHWLLKKKQTAKLSGITLPFHPENDYRIVNIWMLHHPEDTNKGNNSNSGLTGFYKGASFKTDPKLVVRMCPH